MFYLYTGLGFILLNSLGEYFAYRETYIRRSINSVFLVSYLTGLHFLLFEMVLPLFRRPHKKYLQAFVLLAGLGLLYTFGLYGWRWIFIRLGLYTDFTPQVQFPRGVAVHAQFSLAYLIFFAIVRNIYNNNRLREKNNQLLLEKKVAELNYLKAQTNPHFLFNTLNNIYALARDKHELAPESILRLSKILRFMLYETGGEVIVIEQELKIMDDYIALEKLRYDDSLQVSFDTDLEHPKQLIPPLLLIPLVENAFKHGVSETGDKPFIALRLSVTRQQLLFIVRNSTAPNANNKEVKENIGLSNLRKQLALLYREYDLAVCQEEAVFSATLRINLASHV